MDILKVLSRGTKKSAKSQQPGGNALHNLPSAGIKTNPQLFHDQVRGQKRKRMPTESAEATDEDLPDVDFFAPKNETPSNKKADSGKTKRAASPTPKKPTKKLSEEECRQLLRSHRLKMALLSKEEEEKKPKKSKKKKAAPEETKKDDKKHKQLFPQPLESFGQLRNTYGISRRVAENLLAQSYRVPTEVQMGSLPLLLRPELALGDDAANLAVGVDFLAVAPTGSGKTISFLIPAVNNIMRRRAALEDKEEHGPHGPEAVILVPTRELCHQIVNEGMRLLQGTGVRIVGMKKNMNLEAEEQAEEDYDDNSDKDDEEDSDSDEETKGKKRPTSKVDILVTTPVLLLNHLKSGEEKTHKVLPSVRDLVLDEADVLLDPLFREQTMGVWTTCTNTELRVSFWSATMGSNIESLVTEKLKSRAESLSISQRPFVRLVVGLKDTAVPNIVHKLTYTASEQGKLLALRQLLHPTAADDSGPPLRPPFIVFVQTIDRASALHEELKYDIPLEAGGAARVAALHSSLPESARAAIMRKFRAGEIWVLITTDVLARGIDFAGVNGVVNYDVPGSSAAYVHRAGRTGRAGREGGVAVTFYTKEDIPFVKTVANVIAASEKQAGKTGDQASVQKWLLDALPKVNKADRKTLRERGVESRRSGNKAKITSTSGYERRKEHNRLGAIEGSKRRKAREAEEEDSDGGSGGEWGGIDG
ncbi:RNA-dependent ATPase rok1 [Lecanicillium sp. MT-2017a]|nr:RNA-dependent ATPase rok1 [Lecanicillium sp. MT-2017a]